MSTRTLLREGLETLGWANAYELVQLIRDPDVSLATATDELRAMLAEGELTVRMEGGRVQYALASAQPSSGRVG